VGRLGADLGADLHPIERCERRSLAIIPLVASQQLAFTSFSSIRVCLPAVLIIVSDDGDNNNGGGGGLI
jgi:hypothetical protein